MAVEGSVMYTMRDPNEIIVVRLTEWNYCVLEMWQY